MDCILCCEQQQVLGISQCNHNPICYKCVYKMRVISKNKTCPICKVQSKQVVISRQKNQDINQFKNFNLKSMLRQSIYQGICFQDELVKSLFGKLAQHRCFVPKCDQDKSFNNVAFLKKHLKQKHNRFLCDICLEFKTCVLEEHKLYSSKALDKHLKKGDFDQWGNLVFLHPYCDFCKQYFFDQDAIKKHLGREHYICNTCPTESYKYVYYKNYKSLEIHFKMTHYLCPDPDCISKGFTVFKTASDLQAHKTFVHDKSFLAQGGKQNVSGLAGFYSEGNRQQTEKVKFQDKEGLNFQQQFLSLKKTKMRSLDAVDQHKDQQFDFRQFYQVNLEQDQLLQKAFLDTSKNTKKNDQKTNPSKKKQYKAKEELFKKQESNVSNNQNSVVYLQNLFLTKTVYMPSLQYKQFQERLMKVLTQDQYERFSELKHNYIKKKLEVSEFFKGYIDLFGPNNLQLAYNIWPQFIRTIQNEHTRIQLDQQYLRGLKNLTKKTQSLVNSSGKYSQFFDRFLHQIQLNIQKRIINGSMNIKTKVKMDKERIFQMIQVIRHVKTHEMARLKFGTNFGLSQNVIQMIQKKLIVGNITDIGKGLETIPEKQLLNLFLYVKFCNDVLHEKQIHLEKKFIKQEILQDFLEKRPELLLKYGKRKQSMTLDEQAQYEQEMQKKIAQKALMKLQAKNFEKKKNAVLIDQSDKYDFPDLVDTKKQQKREKITPKTEISNEEYINTIVLEKKKPATLQKNLNEFFPDLSPTTNVQQQSNQSQKIGKQKGGKEKPWWQQQKKQQEPGKLPGEIKRQKKKKKQIIYVQGGFK